MLMCLERIKLILAQLFIGNILSSLGMRHSLTPQDFKWPLSHNFKNQNGQKNPKKRKTGFWFLIVFDQFF